jgi:hypothetical protein
MGSRLAFLLLLGSLLLAGCASHPSQSTAGTSTPTPNANDTVPPTANATGGAAFVLAGPILRFANGTGTTTFHEDDAIVAHYELSLTPTSPRDGTALSALLVNGKVVSIETVNLQPGQTKAFDPAVSLANATKLDVVVKVGAARGEANASVVRWPRLHQAFPLGGANLDLTGWTATADGGHADLSAWTPADGSVTGIKVALLCRGADGKLGPQDEQAATLLAGGAETSSLDFGACASPYGLAVTATDADGAHAGRILFGA